MKSKDLADFDRVLAYHLRRMADALESGTADLIDASLHRSFSEGSFELEVTASYPISRDESDRIAEIVDRIGLEEEDEKQKELQDVAESLRRLYYEVDAIEGEGL